MPKLAYTADDHAAVLDVFLAGYDTVSFLVLREAIRALLQDKQRLDWIEREANRVGEVRIEAWEAKREALGLRIESSLRAAIDATGAWGSDG